MKNIFIFVLAVTWSCKSAEINKNIKEIEERKTIAFSNGYSKKREIQLHKYQNEFNLKTELISSKKICDENQTKEFPQELETKKSIDFNSQFERVTIEEKRITEMLMATSKMLNESNTILSRIGEYQKNLRDEEVKYSKIWNNYNQELSAAIKTQFANNKIENCLLKNEIINNLIKLQEKDFEQERTEALILFRPNAIQRLFNLERNRIYKTVHY
jgi:serine protease inhibitor ecotin